MFLITYQEVALAPNGSLDSRDETCETYLPNVPHLHLHLHLHLLPRDRSLDPNYRLFARALASVLTGSCLLRRASCARKTIWQDHL